MNILNLLYNGARKAVSAYRFLILIWLVFLMLISVVALPLKAEFNSAFGHSMLQDSLTGGFDTEVFGDMGPVMSTIMSHLTTGSLLLLLFSVLLYSFFAGGLFAHFTSDYGTFRIHDYIKASAHHFFSFVAIGFVIAGMIILWAMLTFLIPIGILKSAESSAGVVAIVARVMAVIFLLGMPVLLLIADNARRWVTTTGTKKIFKSIGEGFHSTFTRLGRSYFVILIIMIVNLLLSWLMMRFTLQSVPEKGFMILLFFIMTQLLFIIKLWLKAWRYSVVTEIALHR